MSEPIRHPSAGYDLSPDQLLFTVEEAARVLHIGRTTVFALIKSGNLRPVHIGRSTRVSRGELERYVARLDGRPDPGVPARRPRRPRAAVDQPDLFDPGHPQDAA